METDSDRYRQAIQAYMQKSGDSYEATAMKCGVSVRTLHRWIAGDTPIPPKRFETIRSAVGETNSGLIVDNAVRIPSGRIKRYPVVTDAYCAEHGLSPTTYHQIMVNNAWDGEWIYVENDGRELIAFRAKGDSMAPAVVDGEYVVVDIHSELRSCFGKVVACVYVDDVGDTDEHLIIKRLGNDDGTRVVFTSDNPSHPPIILRRDRIKFIWRVVWATRRL